MAKEPTTDRGRRSRDGIVEAAAALVAERGVERTGIDHVLAAAGASKSQLYHYFDSKEALVRAVITRRFEQLMEGQSPAIYRLDDWDEIRGWFDAFIAQSEAIGHPGCPIGTLASELADRDDEIRTELADCFNVWADHLIDGLTRMRDRGDLRPDADPRELGLAAFASLQGGLLLAKTHKSTEPLRIALDAAYAYLRSASAEQTTQTR